MTYYYERGGAEIEQFRADKSGLALAFGASACLKVSRLTFFWLT